MTTNFALSFLLRPSKYFFASKGDCEKTKGTGMIMAAKKLEHPTRKSVVRNKFSKSKNLAL
jgi:hypothetical protein